MSALEQKLLFCFPKKNQMCKQRSNYYHYYCLICSMWCGIKRWNVQTTCKQLFLSVLCQVKDKKRGKQWFSRGTAKCVSTFPSSLRVTSAAPQTAGRRSRLQQPYSSATPLKSGPPETGKKKNRKQMSHAMTRMTRVRAWQKPWHSRELVSRWFSLKFCLSFSFLGTDLWRLRGRKKHLHQRHQL